MIGWLKGTVLDKSPSNLLLNVNSVGYRLFITLSTYEKLPAKGLGTELYTVTVSREDALHLYGFADMDEKEMFLKLISVTRVGPKLACQALSGTTAGEMRKAIAKGDHIALSKRPGIGKKTAERIIMELKDKIGETAIDEALPHGDAGEDAVAALENLGYKKAESMKAVAKVLKEDGSVELSAIIRGALKLLSPS